MMPKGYVKYLLFLTSYMLAVSDLNAQTDCSPVYKLFDTGRAKVWHSTSGDFWKAPHQGNGFEIIDEAISDGPVQVTREAGLWIIGQDSGGNVKSSLPKPVGRGWHPGPLNDDGQSTPELCNNFNKIWEVTLDDLKKHQADFADGKIDGPIPENIKAWPGNNNPFFEEANGFEYLYGLELAPFFDYGDNGIPDGNYNPEKGDYPYIKELRINQHPVLMQWWVVNDTGVYTPGVTSSSIRTQIQITAYSFDRPCIESTSIFYDLEMINMGFEPINDVRIGFWVNPGLGCLEDDYFGCDPERNLMFVYNGDEIDGSNNCLCDSEDIAMCKANCMFGMAVLRGPLDENFSQVGLKTINYFDNNPTAQSEMQPPNSFDAYNNYLAGKWADGTPLTRLGNGFNPSSFDSTNYVFYDRPSELDGWSMCTTSNIDQVDPTILCSFDDFLLFPYAKNQLIFMVMVTDPIEQEACGPLYALSNLWRDNFDKFEVHEVFIDPCATPPPPPQEINLEVFPNPASEFAIIKPPKGKQLKIVRLIDVSGRIINEFNNIQEEELRIENPKMNGIFFIQIFTTDNEKSTHKILFNT